MPKPPAPPKPCSRCGARNALPNRILCHHCLASAISHQHAKAANERRRAAARLLAPHLQPPPSTPPIRLNSKSDLAKLRANPNNYAASNRAIHAQINWMEANHLLPVPRPPPLPPPLTPPALLPAIPTFPTPISSPAQ